MNPSLHTPLSPITKKRAFTLVELLAVVAIIGVLASMALPALSRAKTRSQTAKCGENVRRLLVAIQMYAADNDGNLPYSHYADATYAGLSQLWWHREIAPYVGFTWDNAFYEKLGAKQATVPDIFRCPADPLWGKTKWGPDTSIGYNIRLGKTIPESIPASGTGHTKLASVEHPAEMITLADGGHPEEDGDIATRIAPMQAVHSIVSRHEGHATVGWLDGHVTLESTERIKELQGEAYPWPHWMVAP